MSRKIRPLVPVLAAALASPASLFATPEMGPGELGHLFDGAVRVGPATEAGPAVAGLPALMSQVLASEQPSVVINEKTETFVGVKVQREGSSPEGSDPGRAPQASSRASTERGFWMRLPVRRPGYSTAAFPSSSTERGFKYGWTLVQTPARYVMDGHFDGWFDIHLWAGLALGVALSPLAAAVGAVTHFGEMEGEVTRFARF